MTGMFDKAKDAIQDHSDQAGQAIERGGDFVDDKTGGQHSDQIDSVQDKARDAVGGDQNAEGNTTNG